MADVNQESSPRGKENAGNSIEEANPSGYGLEDSHFQLPIRHVPSRLSDIHEEIHLDQDDATDDDDESTTGSWQLVLTPTSESIADTETDEVYEKIPEEETRPKVVPKEFFEAVRLGKNELVTDMLDRGMDIDWITDKKFTALVISILEGHVDTMKLLLERGADVRLRARNFPPIVHAVMQGELAPNMLRLLIDHGASPHAPYGADRFNCLHRAADEGRLHAVHFFVREGMDLDKPCAEGRTPLILAAERGYTTVVKYLLDKGADLLKRSDNGGTALIWAALNGRLDTVKLLLQKGIEIEDEDSFGQTALYYASNYGHAQLVEILIDRGANINHIGGSPTQFTPAMGAASLNQTEVLEILIQKGAKLDIRTSKEETVLDVALNEGHVEVVKVLLKVLGGPTYPVDSVAVQLAMTNTQKGVNSLIATTSLMFTHFEEAIKAPGKFAWMDWVLKSGGDLVKARAMHSLMHIALADVNLDMVQALLDHGYDPNTLLVSGHTPLSCAVVVHNSELVSALLRAGADPAIQGLDADGFHFTPLLYALGRLEKDLEKDTTIVDLLLGSGRCRLLTAEHPRPSAFSYLLDQFDDDKNGVAEILAFRMFESIPDVNAERSDDGTTLIHVAVQHHRKDLIDILLQKGADINATDDLGQTPFFLECHKGAGFLPFLLERGADVSAKDKLGRSALHIVAKDATVETLQFLLDKGLDINAQTEEGYFPFDFTLKAGSEELSIFLLEHGARIGTKLAPTPIALLHHSAQYGHWTLASKALAQKPINVNTPDEIGIFPLHWAVRHNRLSAVQNLLTAGADTNAVDNVGDQALHIALTASHTAIAHLLISHGADITAPDAAGQTPLHTAAARDNIPVVRLLLDRNVPVDALDAYARTPLCRTSNAAIVQLLVARGANVNHVDGFGWTPLHRAVSWFSTSAMRILFQAGADPRVRVERDGLDVWGRIWRIGDEEIRTGLESVYLEEVGRGRRETGEVGKD